MGQALYRKYRSKKLSEIVGQEHITKTLDNALKSGAISHAYLFTGPRGVGKTSIARILAHEINKIPYDSETTHLDIIEIDAASNRRIDEIRDLRDKVHIAPTSASYKVYIIDEVHMLTKEAFNALLKTLEEPPAHVVFILATTEAHKLPETIVSRTQQFRFKPIETKDLVSHLKQIAKSEGIKIDDTALELISQHGQGSFRDSISLLDQASSTNSDIKEEHVLRLLGIPPHESIEKLVTSLASGNTSEIVLTIKDLRDQGFYAPQIAKQLSESLRQQLVTGEAIFEYSQQISLLKELLGVSAAADPAQMLEIVLLGAALSNTSQSLPEVEPAKVSKPVTEPAPEDQTEPDETTKKQKPKIDESQAKPLDLDMWSEILSAVKNRHNALYGVLRMAEPKIDKDQNLILAFQFGFHKKRLEESRNRQLVVEAINSMVSQPVSLKLVIDKSAKPYVTVSAAGEQPPVEVTDINTISNIFGGGEVLD